MRINSFHDALAHFPDIDGYWQDSDLHTTEVKVQSLLPSLPLVEWNSKAVENLTQLARAQALLGKMSEARATLEQAQQMALEHQAELEPRTEVRILLEQGRVMCLEMKVAKAQELFTQAWSLASEKGLWFFAVDAALMLSTVRPPKFQNEWLKKALAIAEIGNDDTRRWLAQLLFLDAWHAYDVRQYESALELFGKAIAQPLLSENSRTLLALKWSFARTLRALGRTPEALAGQEELLKQMSQSGTGVNGHVYLEIAECKQLLNQKEEAKASFELAYVALGADAWYADNMSDELERMKYLYKKR